MPTRPTSCMRLLAGKTVLTTLKDAVKLSGRLPDACDAYGLLIEARLDDTLHDPYPKPIYRNPRW
jgi:hypothetical protein